MNEEQKFRIQCLSEISEQGSSDTLNSLTRQWVDESIKLTIRITLIGLVGL